MNDRDMVAFWKRLATSGIASKLKSTAGFRKSLFDFPQRIFKPVGKNILVIAPHPDDECLGCGGTLYKHAEAGDRVVVTFMTDGSKGDAFCAERSHALVERRKREATAAQEVLGISELVFLDNPDTRLKVSRKTVDQVVSILDRVQPDVVYVPCFLDTHADHQASFEITAAALDAHGSDSMLYLYEVWSPLFANRVVEIDIQIKVRALKCHASQIDDKEMYVVGTKSLAKYRAISTLMGVDAFAECFWQLDPDELADMTGKLTG